LQTIRLFIVDGSLSADDVENLEESTFRRVQIKICIYLWVINEQEEGIEESDEGIYAKIGPDTATFRSSTMSDQEDHASMIFTLTV
jgi:hypothetical protein